jgi:DNA-directed RNA polymerase subunit K/omega
MFNDDGDDLDIEVDGDDDIEGDIEGDENIETGEYINDLDDGCLDDDDEDDGITNGEIGDIEVDDEDGENNEEINARSFIMKEYKQQQTENMLNNANSIVTIKITPDDERITSDQISINELSNVLSIRANLIAKTATFFVDAMGKTNPIDIAHDEIYQKKCPLKIRRVTKIDVDGEITVEDWSVNELTIPSIPSKKYDITIG